MNSSYAGEIPAISGNALWYVRNSDLHRDIGVGIVANEIN